MKTNILRVILIILLLCMFWIIFGFSNQDGEESSAVSRKVTEFIVEKIIGVSEINKVEFINNIGWIIRKFAHFSIYTVVGFLLMALISTYNLERSKKIKISFIIGIIYAISDEIHQSFIPGRAAKLMDVMIDSVGVFVGILILMLILAIMKKIKVCKNKI